MQPCKNKLSEVYCTFCYADTASNIYGKTKAGMRAKLSIFWFKVQDTHDNV